MPGAEILCWERRLCVRAWLCRCFGTAMERERLLEAKLAELGPARVGLALVVVVGPRAVQVLAADRAEAGAVLAAHDPSRQRERQRVTRPAPHVELVLIEVGRAKLVAGARLIHLARVHGNTLIGGFETAHARAFEGRLEAEPQRVTGARGARGVQG